MKEAPYRPGQPYDDWFAGVIQSCETQMAKNEDDTLILFVGSPGAGKSNLMLHAVEAYNPDVDPDMVCLTTEKWAKKQYEAVQAFYNGQKKNVVPYDEAKLVSRDAMTQLSKDTIKLMYQNRAAQIFHPWCWPTLQMFEKEFLNDRVKGVFFCHGKWQDKPRIYYFYPISAINKLIRDGYKLSHFVLKHKAKKYALYKGRFCKYEGKLLAPYKEIKQDGVLDAAKEFMDKYSKEGELKQEPKFYSTGEVADALGVSTETVLRKKKLLLQLGLIQRKPGVANKAWGYTPEAVEYLRNFNKNVAIVGDVADFKTPFGNTNRAKKEILQEVETNEY